MAISYEKLFLLAKEKGLNKSNIRNEAGISTVTMAKLTKNENVSMDVIAKLCRTLKYQLGDILTYKIESVNELLNNLREEKEMNSKGSIYHTTQIKLAYNSNRIEGSRL